MMTLYNERRDGDLKVIFVTTQKHRRHKKEDADKNNNAQKGTKERAPLKTHEKFLPFSHHHQFFFSKTKTPNNSPFFFIFFLCVLLLCVRAEEEGL